MAIKINEGFKVPGKGLTPAAIMSLLTEHIIKKDSDSIGISDLQVATSEPREGVIDALKFLCEKGWVKIKNGDWEEAGSIRIEGFQILVGIDQLTLPSPRPEPPDTSNPEKNRQETGSDEVQLGGKIYFGHVEYCGEQGEGCYLLTIKSRTIESRIDDLDDLYGSEWKSMEEAWSFFDNFISKYSRDKTGEMYFQDSTGIVWHCETMDEDGPEEGTVTGKIGLNISYKPVAVEAFYIKAELVFDTLTEAWAYVDEYLESPAAAEDEPAVSAASFPWDGEKEPDITGEIKHKKLGEVSWKLWKDCIDGFDWFYFTQGDRVRHIGIPSADLMADKRSTEKVAADQVDLFNWESEPEPVPA